MQYKCNPLLLLDNQLGILLRSDTNVRRTKDYTKQLICTVWAN